MGKDPRPFTFRSDQTFCDWNCGKLLVNFFWLKETSQFCRKLIYVSCKVTFFLFGHFME